MGPPVELAAHSLIILFSCLLIRCGIVLCARDAKFAVECDTCKMSYCLVCLASGTKDPCVRCGHRPSKRVEQLVHLRLKSIYKAFKQSGASGGSSTGAVPGIISGDGGDTQGDEAVTVTRNGAGRDISTIGGKYSSALRSLTENESLGSSKDNFGTFDQSMANEVAAVLQTASNAMVSEGGDDRRSRGKRVTSHHSSSSSHDHGSGGNNPSGHGRDNLHPSTRPKTYASEGYYHRTQAEIVAAAKAAEAEAEAAAAALLAELDEEMAASSKKGKKKKKKGKKKDPSDDTPGAAVSPDNSGSDGNTATQKKKGASSPQNLPTPQDDESSEDEEMILEQLVGITKSSRSSKKGRNEEETEKSAVIAPQLPEPKIEVPAAPMEETPDYENELAVLLSNDDEEGLEEFLANVRGVPGLSTIRKAAKKALKKMKGDTAFQTVVEPEDVSSKVSSSDVESTANPSASNMPASTQHEPLLRVVSRTQSAVGAVPSKGATSTSTSVPASARAECVMHMAPKIVGWVIGKGGQRIRDMMEESGAKIWIDQESMGTNDARVVYVSGKRSAVDAAVRMVKDLVAKAPVPASAPTAQGVAPASTTTTSTASPTPAKSPPSVPSSLPSSTALEPSKEPPSFAAAIASKYSSPVAVTPPVPTSSVATKTAAAQSWSSPALAASTPVAPMAPPQPTPPPATTISVQPTGSLVEGPGNLMAETVTKELLCAPQFAALLVGRNGIVARNIQTESGATFIVNQSVQPPKIIISGKTEHVKKAELLVRGVLNHQNKQLSSQAVPQQHDGALNNIQPATESKNRHDQNAGDVWRQHHDRTAVPSAQIRYHKPLDDVLPQQPRRLSNNASSSVEGMVCSKAVINITRLFYSGRLNLILLQNYPPGYNFQQQSNLGLFQDSRPANTTPDMMQNENHLAMPGTSVGLRHQEWAHQQTRNMPPQYPSISSYSNAQINVNEQFLRSNPYPFSTNHPNNVVHTRAPAYPIQPDQHSQMLHNLEHTLPSPSLSRGRSDGVDDFLLARNVSQNADDGWGLNTNRPIAGETWRQSQNTPVASPNQPTFGAQRSLPLESTLPVDNLFQNQLHQQPRGNPSGVTTVRDDSQFVDSMFDSLGGSGSEGDSLLNALNSVSLGGTQQGTWGGGGWGGGESGGNSSSLLHNSRLGGIAFGSTNQNNKRNER